MVVITKMQDLTDGTPSVAFHYPGEGGTEAGVETGNVLVSFLFSPINPQDLLVLAGRYPVKPSYTQGGQPILGYDGVARVEAVGPMPSTVPGVSPVRLQPGDLVIPRRHGLGTWRTRAILRQSDVIRMSPTSELMGASMLRMAFLPAYLLMEDMCEMKPGDWVVQNAGSSTIAQLIVQFARLKGVHTCSVVRDRSAHASKSLEKTLGDNDDQVIITQSELAEKGAEAHPALADAVRQGRTVLALDAVFGEPGRQLASLLSHGGTYVNYGSLGGPDSVLAVSQRLLFWSEITFRNFRLSAQLNKRNESQQETLLLWFQDLLTQGILRTPKVQTIQVPTGLSAREGFEEHVKRVIAADKVAKVGNAKWVLDLNAPSVGA